VRVCSATPMCPPPASVPVGAGSSPTLT
jgi:hypothetical protein